MKVGIINVPDTMKDDEFDRNLAHLQVQADRLETDISEKFRLCLHEGNHLLHTRRQGWKVKELRGPHVELEDGELSYRRGCVVPELRGCGLPNPDVLFYDWGVAKVYVAGFMTVEHFTGEPNGQHTIDSDLRCLKECLDTTPERLQQAIRMGKLLVREDFDKPWFLDELGSCVREYEMTVFGTDATWLWGCNGYKLHIPGRRYQASVCVTNESGGLLSGLLIERGNEVRLFVGRVEYGPNDKIRGLEPLVMLPRRVRGFYAAKKWNDKVRAAMKCHKGRSRSFADDTRVSLNLDTSDI
jgi:hypothetical protein